MSAPSEFKPVQLPEGRGMRLVRQAAPTLTYWMKTEVHVYGFSIAVNALLAFFPFLIVIFSICRHTLGWTAAVNAVGFALNDFFPGEPYVPYQRPNGTMLEFIHRNLVVTASSRGTLQVVSLLLLLFTANGIFEPLEVALNRIWGIRTNRSYFKNQLVSLGLIFVCGTLALGSTVLTGMKGQRMIFKLAVAPISILILFLVYWLLPNAKIPARRVLPAAVVTGLALEVLKYINQLTWPLWREKLSAEYGPFAYSVTIILWSFLGAMVILAGAEWAARRVRRDPLPEETATG